MSTGGHLDCVTVGMDSMTTQLKMECTAYTHGGTTNRSKTTPQGVQ